MFIKRLIIMRHAKSDWGTDAANDHARPLNKRGRRDAPRIAARIGSLGWAPELVVSSDSERTQQTWTRMAPLFDGDIEVRFTRDLYHAGLGEIQASAEQWPEAVETVLVLGHNPGWEHAVGHLSGEMHSMTTANAGLLVGEGTSWADALTRPWTLEALLRPKELGDESE